MLPASGRDRPWSSATTWSARSTAAGSWVAKTTHAPRAARRPTESSSRRPGFVVQLGGRFVGQQHGRTADGGHREGEALLLAARELRGAVVAAAGQAEASSSSVASSGS